MPTNETLVKNWSIADLAGQVFHIPWYQRGFRWTSAEVRRLLEDIDEYRNSEDTDSCYCLQPICVSRYMGRDNEWVVIDGQQRLTTIYLILQVGKYIMEIAHKKGFSIQYDTRKEIDDFLKNLDLSKSPEEVSENKSQAVERYYLQNALLTIDNWFSERGNLLDFMMPFTASSTNKKHVELIQYDTQATSEAENIRLFNRLNSGKIPLTNAELIKALLLNVGSEEKQYQCAEEWNRIENDLEDDEFWHFLYAGDAAYETRIDLLFSTFLALRNDGKNDDTADRERLHIFYGIKAIVDRQNAEGERFELWREVVEHYARLREWYEDELYFHRIGFLVQCGDSLPELLKIKKNKDAFMGDVQERIRERIKSIWPKRNDTKAPIELSGLDYEKHGKCIRKILLLFNVESILKNPKSGYRFSFSAYFNEDWDIEHIRSISSMLPENVDEQRKWFRCVLQYYTGIDLEGDKGKNKDQGSAKLQETSGDKDKGKDAVQKWIDDHNHKWMDDNKKIGECDLVVKLFKCVFGTNDDLKELASDVFKKIIIEFNEKTELETRNDIGNLALLDAETNRSYKNALFPVKRKRILQNNAESKFVPPCTLNAFLKYYSKFPRDVLIWTDDDSDEYREAIETLLNGELKYLPYSKQKNNDNSNG